MKPLSNQNRKRIRNAKKARVLYSKNRLRARQYMIKLYAQSEVEKVWADIDGEDFID